MRYNKAYVESSYDSVSPRFDRLPMDSARASSPGSQRPPWTQRSPFPRRCLVGRQNRCSLARLARTPGRLGASLPTLRPLVRPRPLRRFVSSSPSPGPRAGHGRLDLLQGSSSFVRSQKKRGPQAIGVSRGGLNTKIHALCDALGNPLRFKLTAGNISDTGELLGLVEGVACSEILADKAYDSNEIVEALNIRGIEVVIPPKINRKLKREFDSIKYRGRHLIENLFQRMKVFRRIATRFEKLDTRFLGLGT